MFGMNLDSVITILGVVAVIFTVLARTDALEKKFDAKLGHLSSELRTEIAELRNDNKVLEGRIFLLAAGMEQPALTGADAVTNAVMAAPKIAPTTRGRARSRR